MTREPAFDRMLRIPHIIEGIFLQFLPFWSDEGVAQNQDQAQQTTTQRHTLAQLARVCKAFSLPALDILWKNLDDLGHLLRVFPSYQLQDQDHRYIIDEITPPLWHRFQQYACRVCSLNWTASLLPEHWIVWTLLEQQSGGQPLLPRLHTLEILELDPNHAQSLLLLLAPSLRVLRLSFIKTAAIHTDQDQAPGPSPAGILLQLIAPRLSCLSSFCIEGGLTAVFPSRYLTCLTQLSRLENLDLLYSGVEIDAEAFQHISNMTSLRVLYLDVYFEELSSDFSRALRLGGAPIGLRDLHLTGSIDDLVHVFQAAQFPNVTTLSLSISSSHSMDELKDGLGVICSKVSRSVLEVHLSVLAQILSDTVTLGDLLQPYLSFRGLSIIRIEFSFSVPLMDDQDALAFASAWPSLTDFHWHNRSWTTGIPPVIPTQPTVAGLLSFAQRCPLLHNLRLPYLDVGALPSPLSIPAAGQKAMRTLTILQYVETRTANLLDLAVIIDRLFPECNAADTHPITMQNAVIPHVVEGDPRYRAVKFTELLIQAVRAQRRLQEGDGPSTGTIGQ